MGGVQLPIVQAPMVGAGGVDLAAAVAAAGGLGSLPCATLDAAAVQQQHAEVQARTSATTPVNLNFFCHTQLADDTQAAAEQAAWGAAVAALYQELGLEAPSDTSASAGGGRAPFSEAACEAVEAVQPAVVSFHFGLPDASLLQRVHASGATVMASATTVEEARWLEQQGCDVIIAQGAEAGGHRGVFLAHDATTACLHGAQSGTFALLPQVVDAVSVPVIAAGGISDGRGIAAALALGAAGVQLGTAYMLCRESTASAMHREALAEAGEGATVITNVFTGRPARGLRNRAVDELGPCAAAAPTFPGAATLMAPLRSQAEAAGSAAFSPLWAGQAAPIAAAAAAAAAVAGTDAAPSGGGGGGCSAGALTAWLAKDAARHLRRAADTAAVFQHE